MFYLRILLSLIVLVSFPSWCFCVEWDNVAISEAQHHSDEIEADPHGGSATWLNPIPIVQQSQDAKLRSVTKGGVFVPAMTTPVAEPKYRVLSIDGEEIEEAYPGTSVYVQAGDYVVEVGTGAAADRLKFDVSVSDGIITFVPVEWSGLVVKVVNDRGSSIRGNYELVRLPEREYIGHGTGALISEGERLNTWILWPGLYMIISAGEGYQARKNFITVDLKPGALSLITLVLDEETGDIRGGGEIDIANKEDKSNWWDFNLLIGGSTRFNRSDNVVGKSSGQILDISGFVESTATIFKKNHYFYGRLNAEIGGIFRLDGRPFTSTIDELSLELLYAYRVVRWFGPYTRFSFESNMAPAYQGLERPYNVEISNSQAKVIQTKTNQIDLKLSPSFSPITLNAGAGARFDYSYSYWLRLNARLGIGYRHVFTRDLYVVTHTDEEESTVKISEIDDTEQFGVEAALRFDITPLHWLSFKIDASILEPFTDWKSPFVDMRGVVAIRLSSIASISYTLRMVYDLYILNKLQIDQFLQLRFSYKFF